jgi:hypothetical protein
VALDVDPAPARPWIERVRPEHPALIDRAHVIDELLGIINVPNGVWIDEQGFIVRPAEPAWSMTVEERRRRTPPAAPRPAAPREDFKEVQSEVMKIRFEPERYVNAIRDWAEKGPASRWAMTPEKVIERSGGRSFDNATAAAHFELGEHLHQQGAVERAQHHWRQAHRLFPDNWTYKRQAWELVSPRRQGRTDVYDSSWIDDVRALGAERYYPPLEE